MRENQLQAGSNIELNSELILGLTRLDPLGSDLVMIWKSFDYYLQNKKKSWKEF